MIWGRTVALVNARVLAPEGVADSLRFASSVIAIGDPPKRGDVVIDLQGDVVLPGLVNAHDHLELNHFGRLKFRDRYRNVTEWIDDMQPRLATDPRIRDARQHPLTERLFVGALKNLLSGVTTVAHHNPYYRELRRTMPIRVLRRYGWAHSFALADRPAGARGEPGGDVARRWRRTPADAPFFVHLAEGVDRAAGSELARLEALGCLTPNTVLVHGVAIDADGWRRVARTGAGLVWCPASNEFLFGRTADVGHLLASTSVAPAPVALGTDSRLTGSRDLLDELRTARASTDVSAAALLAMVTSRAAALLRLRRSGALAVGNPADLVVVPMRRAADPGSALLAARRRDLGLVAVGGRPLVGDAVFAPVFRARGVTPRPIEVDDALKVADGGLVRRISGCPIAEPGVQVV